MTNFLNVLSVAGAVAVASIFLCAQTAKQTGSIPYLKLTSPRHVLPDAQPWEGNEFPHTMSVLDMKRGGFRYHGWYGLNEGRGIGLARSNDLVNWTKYEQNPLWTNACWPTPIQNGPAATSSLPMGEFTGAIFHYLGRFRRVTRAGPASLTNYFVESPRRAGFYCARG